jgi:hypothetical protein
MIFSNRQSWEKPKQPGRHFILRGSGITRIKELQAPVMFDDRLGETDELRVTTAEIFLTVIGTRACGATASGTFAADCQLMSLAGPATFRALHTLADAGNKLEKRRFQGNGGVNYQIPLSQPSVEENGLRQTARKAVEHPAAGLAD